MATLSYSAMFSYSAAVLLASLTAAGAQDVPLREGRSAVRSDWRDHVEQSRQSSAAFVGAAVDAFRLRQPSRKLAVQPIASAKPVPVSYLDDPTLRYGDVVAIEGRLVVFRGTSTAPHRSGDFQDVDAVGSLGGVHDREIHELDGVLARASGRR